MDKISEDQKEQPQPDYDDALWRMMFVVGAGCAVIVIYALVHPLGFSAHVLSVALMSAGAALLAGGLLGFLFGIPHTRENDSPKSNGKPTDNDNEQEGDTLTSSYSANTSLEQISDWLTKIIVGIGLVQFNAIQARLTAMASHIAEGLGEKDGALAFALAILIYFSICGFVFGFLWARLYLKRWFALADTRLLRARLTRLERRQRADARALGLIHQLLNPGADEDRPTDEVVKTAIMAASRSVKAHIYYQAKETYEDREAHDYGTKLRGVISILGGLTADTTKRFHENYSLLSYALSRLRPAPPLSEAMSAINTAIEIRDNSGERGWKYYDLRRARYRVQLDASFNDGKPSDSEVKDQILKDLKRAALGGSVEILKRWYAEETQIAQWMKLNGIKEFNGIDI